MKYTKLLLLLCLFCTAASAEIRLPKLIGDGMILQRDMPVKIWGWATPEENISIQIDNGVKRWTEVDKNGYWQLVLPNQQAGGPHSIVIQETFKLKQIGSQKKINDVWFGDVWVCSGQSNMELPVYRILSKYKHIEANPQIRQFLVPQDYNFHAPQTDFASGSWVAATPETLGNFSAVAYFFAQELYDRYKVPVGLINNALGGSPAEAWISEDSLKRFPHYYSELQRFKNDQFVDSIINSDRARMNAWYSEQARKDKGYSPVPWSSENLNTNDWDIINIPGYWPEENGKPINGVMWFRRDFDLTESLAKQPAKIILGCIVDADSVFINGKFVGNTTYQYPPRRYEIPEGVLKAGKNSVTVRVVSSWGRGGFVEDKFYGLEFAGNQTLNLSGVWDYRLGARMEPLESETFVRWKPTGLYNELLAPLFNYAIKGVIWYQGESNTGNPKEYSELFTTLINNWRKEWKQGDFPFLYVQLANFMKSHEQPMESNWAELRETQLQTLALPNTGMAVTIDIGEWNDIHPLNKQDVGKRLALAARKIAYKEDDVVYSGPIYESMQIEGNKIILSFKDTGSGLTLKNGDLSRSFAIADQFNQFFWAKNVEIEDNKVIIWNDEIDYPTAVRYAWADNPDAAILYNLEGLPASPWVPPVSVPILQLLCLPEPFTPLNGFSCSSTRKWCRRATFFITDINSTLWSLAKLISS